MWFSPTFRSTTLCIVIAGCFWWWTYLQWVTMVWYGIPHVTSLHASGLTYYLRPDGWPMHIPRLYLLITILGCGVVALGLPALLEGSKAKIRQLMLIAVFEAIALSVAVFIDRSEAGEIEVARSVIEHYERSPADVRYPGRFVWHVSNLKDELAEIESY